MLPQYFQAPLGDHHRHFWEWAWGIQPDERPDPYLAIWHRKGAKSTSAEGFAVMLGCLGKRRYGLYVSGTQKQADDHVETIGSMLGNPSVQQWYPSMAERAVNQFGSQRAWRRNRLWTSAGFVIDALGLDASMRGVKLEEQRPDFIVVDDVDSEEDSKLVTQNKLDRLVKRILPAGSNDCVIVFMQNLVIEDGVFGRLAGIGRSEPEFLYDRKFYGMVPAIRDMEIQNDEQGRPKITGGEPVWAGFDLEQANQELRTFGINAFYAEFQHQVRKRGQKFVSPQDLTMDKRYDDRDRLRIEKSIVRRIMSWDTAEEEHDAAAWSGCVVVDIIERNDGFRRYGALLRYAHRVRMITTDLEEEVIRSAQEWYHPKFKECWVEYKSSGKAVVHGVRLRGPGWLKKAVREAKARESKDARVATLAQFVREGTFQLPLPTSENSIWLEDFIEELLDLPQSQYRDLTDAAAHAVRAALVFLNMQR